ncbi:uncharacterized protein [Onthophagus taurus]|uniref:uncharacterized protein n=1 Tax=Onthophagus taurus TaxID=166361 RepID=UPI0039BDF273
MLNPGVNDQITNKNAIVKSVSSAINSEADKSIIFLTMGCTKLSFLIDSGSAVSLLKEESLLRTKINYQLDLQQHITLKGITGNEVEGVGFSLLDFRVKNKKFNINCVICKNIAIETDGIIGCDFLISNQAILDYNQGILKLGHIHLKLIMTSSKRQKSSTAHGNCLQNDMNMSEKSNCQTQIMKTPSPVLTKSFPFKVLTSKNEELLFSDKSSELGFGLSNGGDKQKIANKENMEKVGVMQTQTKDHREKEKDTERSSSSGPKMIGDTERTVGPCSALLMEALEIPGRCEVVCEALQNQWEKDEEVIIEPIDTGVYGSMSARVVTRVNKNQRVPVRLINVTEKPLMLNKGTSVGIITRVNKIDIEHKGDENSSAGIWEEVPQLENVNGVNSTTHKREKMYGNYREYEEKISKNIVENWDILEDKGNLFDAPRDYSLAHCVSEDLKMGAGIAAEVKEKFMGIKELNKQNPKVRDVLYLRRDGRYILYLITSRKGYESTLRTLYQTRSLSI